MTMQRPIFTLALCSLTSVAQADRRGDNPDAKPSTPQEQLKMFHVPPGFEVQLVAAEPEIQKPINFTFDGAGRLWVTGSELYPWPASVDAKGEPIPDFAKAYADIASAFRVGDKAPPVSAVAKDTVRILGDFDESGHARKITIFADGLNIPSGVQPLPRGSAVIAKIFPDASTADPNPAEPKPVPVGDRRLREAPKGDSAIVYSIPNIYLLTDWDGDGKADKREVLYGTAGFLDTHGGMSSFLYWIDGWIYGTHGFRNHSELRDKSGRVTVLDSGNTYRFRPDGSAFEIYTHGQTNPFGLTVDPLGNFYSADSHSKPVYMLLRGGYYEGIGKQHDGLGFAPRITDDDHGSTAIAGIAYYADDKFPEEYRGNLFNGNPVTQRINRDKLEWHGSTPRAIRQPDFLTCDDPCFRPVQVKLGPDGALWIADFYNPIIGHYEFPLADPRRDHAHGRIWRVVYRGEKATAATPGGALGPSAASGGSPDASASASKAEGVSANQASSGFSGEPPKTAPEPGAPPSAQMPDLTKLDAAGLIEKLADPNLIVRTLATNELVDRVGRDATAALRQIAKPTNENEFLKKLKTAPTDEVIRGLKWRSPGTQRAHALWTLERLNALDRVTLFMNLCDDISGPEEVHSTKIHAERADLHTGAVKITEENFERLTTGNLLETEFSQHSMKAMAELLALHPREESIKGLVNILTVWPEGDTALIHTARMALRNNLVVPDGYAEAAKFASSDPRVSETIADVSLGAKTPEAAEFLLAHLERTKFNTPRAGEYLKHALLYLPQEKLDGVLKLISQAGFTKPEQIICLATNLENGLRQRGIPPPLDLAMWSRGVIFDALASNVDDLAKQAIAALRDMKLDAKLGPLAKIARDEKRDGALRLAALEATANLPASRDLLVATLGDRHHMILRKRAAELLAQNGHSDVVLAALPYAPDELALSICAALARSDAGTTALLDTIDAGKAPPRLLLNKTVAGPLLSRPKPLRDRATALTKDLPPEDARLNAVIAGRAAAFRDAKPNVDNGLAVFQKHCAVCHRFRNASQGNVGPNLDGIATRGAQRLIEDILDPNRNVDPAFRQAIIETKDGRTFLGVNLRGSDTAQTFTEATGKDTTLARADIKSQTISPLSLMPPVFESALSEKDFADLLAYLLEP